MLFFVMSGFLVSKNIYDDIRAGRWSWIDYAAKRLSRLWIVLIPALLLTSMWDYVGNHYFHAPIYMGLLSDVYNSGPKLNDVGAIYRMDTFLANALFLQTIVTPTFGTNGPLWSLANEFWYYVIFPLGFVAFHKEFSAVWRAISAGFALTICFALPKELVLYGLVWLFGFCVVLVRAHLDLKFRPLVVRALTLCSTLLFLAVSTGGRISNGNVMADFACGATFALFLYCLTMISVQNDIVCKIAALFSNFSYTLYLTHFPFVLFLYCAVLGGTKRQPGAFSCVIYVGMLCLVILYAYLVYFLFERRTKMAQDKFLQSPLVRRLRQRTVS
jgi:peptidoglycan/LPS O-acetylase OafA/YrhL